MKIALIADSHFGVRQNLKQILDSQEKFYREIFFPYLIEHKIAVVVHLGDVFDHRKQINFVTLTRAKDMYFVPMAKSNIEHIIIVGNHDCAWRQSNRLNSPNELLSHQFNFALHWEPTEINLGGRAFAVLPWINDENREASMALIAGTRAEAALGHLEIAGFEMYRGSPSQHGLDRGIFKKFKRTFSGHFHTQSEHDGITYVGNTNQNMWSDCGDRRGFHVLDTDTLETTFIENPFHLFHQLVYDNELPEIDDGKLAGTYVKVMVKDRSNSLKYDKFIHHLEGLDLADLKIVENETVKITQDFDEDVEVDDTATIISKYVDTLDSSVSKDKLKNLLGDLLIEANLQG